MALPSLASGHGSVTRIWALAIHCLPVFLRLAEAGVLHYKHKHLSWVYAPSDTCTGDEEGPCGPNEWHTMPGNEHCLEQGTQSPINVETRFVDTQYSAADVRLHVNGECNLGLFEINEHTAEVKIQDVCPGVYSLTMNGKVFKLLQLHFHSPSEHTINGRYYPMEVHMVHLADDGQALPLGVMLGVGSMPTKAGEFMREMMINMPHYTPDMGDVNYIEEVRDFVDMNPYTRLLPENPYLFAYKGAFTTPPCTSGTQWLLAMSPVTMSQETMESYRRMINALPSNQLAPFPAITGLEEPEWEMEYRPLSYDLSLGCNNRPIQPVRGAADPIRYVEQVEIHLDVAERPEEPAASQASLVVIIACGVMVLGMIIVMIVYMHVSTPRKNHFQRAHEMTDIVPADPAAKGKGGKDVEEAKTKGVVLTF